MTLTALKAALRRGRTPRSLGFKPLGTGFFRTAWTKGGWVVKRQSRYGDRVPEECCGEAESVANDCNIRPAPTHIVGEWEIQRRYSPVKRLSPKEQRLINRCFAKTHNDIHKDNLGRTRAGRLVAFDF